MVNDWECVLTVDVGEGERLVALSWIDTGIKVCIIDFAFGHGKNLECATFQNISKHLGT